MNIKHMYIICVLISRKVFLFLKINKNDLFLDDKKTEKIYFYICLNNTFSLSYFESYTQLIRVMSS